MADNDQSIGDWIKIRCFGAYVAASQGRESGIPENTKVGRAISVIDVSDSAKGPVVVEKTRVDENGEIYCQRGHLLRAQPA